MSSEQPSWLDHQNDDEDDEDAQACEVPAEVSTGECFGQTDNYRADERAPHGAEPADGENDESLDRQRRPESGHRESLGPNEHTDHARENSRERKGKERHVANVHATKERSFAVLAHAHERKPEECVSGELRQTDDDDKDQNDEGDFDQVHSAPENLEDLITQEEGHAVGLASPDDHGDTFEEDRYAQCCDEEVVWVLDWTDRHDFFECSDGADHHAGDDHDQPPRQLIDGDAHIGDECTQHHQGRLREVEGLPREEDDVVADGYESVNGSQGKARPDYRHVDSIGSVEDELGTAVGRTKGGARRAGRPLSVIRVLLVLSVHNPCRLDERELVSRDLRGVRVGREVVRREQHGTGGLLNCWVDQRFGQGCRVK